MEITNVLKQTKNCKKRQKERLFNKQTIKQKR